jgi:YD repeat-containing protein
MPWIKDDLPDGTARSRVKEVRLRPLGAEAFNLETAYSYGSSGADLGRVVTTTNAAGDTVHYRYHLQGQLTRQFGPATYPVAYGYDVLGQRTTMHTFRVEPQGEPESWDLAAGDLTEWAHDPATGLLVQKRYGSGAGAQTISYTHDSSGQILTLTGARGAVTTYSRDTLGRLTGVSYTGIVTPGYTLTYHRNGAVKTVTDGQGTRTFTPRVLDAEGKTRLSLSGTTLLPEAEVTEDYDVVTGQRIGWTLQMGEELVHEVGYGYKETGLLGTVTLREDGEPVASWAHDYAPAMARVARVQGRLGVAGPVHTATSFFDEHLRVEQVAHFGGTQLKQGWSYRFDPLRPQRRVGRTDMVVERPGWAWGYNGRGEVTSAQRTQSVAGAAPVAGQGWGYGYDAIGNRLLATRSTAQVAVIDMAPQDTPETMNTSYTPNRFNQYAGITRPEALEVSGVTDPAVPEVEIMVGPDDPNYAGQSTLQLQDGQTRPLGNGEPGGYGLWVVGNEVNTLGQWPLLSVTASRHGANPSDPSITQTQSGRVWVRPTEAPVHDADGNLVSDGGWTYQWDARKRCHARKRCQASK